MFKLLSVLASLLALAATSPTPTIDLEAHANVEKRATISDAATLGFASQNGGTTGGSGGTVTTVSTLAQFTAAVDEDDTTPRIIVVSGTISGETDIRIGSNKTIVGLPGASEYLLVSSGSIRDLQNAYSNTAFDGVGLYLRRQSNIIIRNIISSKVLASTKGDGIRIDVSAILLRRMAMEC